MNCYLPDYSVPLFAAGIGVEILTEQNAIKRIRARRSGAGL